MSTSRGEEEVHVEAIVSSLLTEVSNLGINLAGWNESGVGIGR